MTNNDNDPEGRILALGLAVKVLDLTQRFADYGAPMGAAYEQAHRDALGFNGYGDGSAWAEAPEAAIPATRMAEAALKAGGFSVPSQMPR